MLFVIRKDTKDRTRSSFLQLILLCVKAWHAPDMSVVLDSVSQEGHGRSEMGTRNVKKMEELPHKEKLKGLRLFHLYGGVWVGYNRGYGIARAVGEVICCSPDPIIPGLGGARWSCWRTDSAAPSAVDWRWWLGCVVSLCCTSCCHGGSQGVGLEGRCSEQAWY